MERGRDWEKKTRRWSQRAPKTVDSTGLEREGAGILFRRSREDREFYKERKDSNRYRTEGRGPLRSTDLYCEGADEVDF